MRVVKERRLAEKGGVNIISNVLIIEYHIMFFKIIFILNQIILIIAGIRAKAIGLVKLVVFLCHILEMVVT